MHVTRLLYGKSEAVIIIYIGLNIKEGYSILISILNITKKKNTSA
jgi:hypothetical protein